MNPIFLYINDDFFPAVFITQKTRDHFVWPPLLINLIQGKKESQKEKEEYAGCGTVLGCHQHTFTGTFEEAIRQGWATEEELEEAAKRALEDLRDHEIKELFTFFEEL